MSITEENDCQHRPGDLVRLQQRERFIPTALHENPASYAKALELVPIWHYSGGRYANVPSGTIATFIRSFANRNPQRLIQCEIMFNTGEIVFCYAAHLDPVVD